MKNATQEISDFMKEASKPLSFKELVHAFNVPPDKRDEFKKTIKGMVGSGTIIRIRGGRFGLPSKMNLVTGDISCHPDGYGFVRPDEGEGEDVYINARNIAGAMHGDKVAVRVEGSRGPGRREGRIIRIIKRAHKTIVGRYTSENGFGVVIPSNAKVLDKIIIPKKEKNGAQDGMIVNVEITRWPTKEASPAGRVLEVIGDPQSPDVEAEVILRKFGLPNKFPPAVLHEVKGVPPAVTARETEGRIDLRGKITVTIDGETAKDFDDAVSIERTEKGYKLRVSIADVSNYVKEGTELDAEAFSRGTSVYFPDRCIPMLPEELSNGICSLNPNVERLTMTAEMDFDRKGGIIGKKFYESVIKSAERLTYTKVKMMLTGDTGTQERYSHILDDIRLMEELALKLMEGRRAEGSIDFDLPEPEIIIDIEGRIEDIVRSERNIAHRIIEEFMLAANKAVATEFSTRKLPFLYRVHEPPDEDSIADFKTFVAGFGLHFKRGLVKEEEGVGPKAFQDILESIKGKPEERLVNHVLLRSMKQAVYSERNIGHFGLAFGHYAHFTSPIRRYPDLVVHRLLKLLIHGRYTKDFKERMEAQLPEIAGKTSACERKAMEAEREIVDLKKAQFMKDKEGIEFDGYVSGVTSFGVFVELKEYFVEALVHVSTLLDDYYIYDEVRHTLTGERGKRSFRVGDGLKVRIERVDLERRRIDAVLAEELQRRTGRFKKGRGR